MITFFKKKVLKWVYKRTGELALLATFEGCAGPLPFTLLRVVLDLLQVPNTLQYRLKIFSVATRKKCWSKRCLLFPKCL